MRILIVPALALILAPALSGCLAKTAYDVATLPVRATSQVVDWTTTSRSEADRNYGRKMRKQQAREGREMRKQAERDRKAQRRQAQTDGY